MCPSPDPIPALKLYAVSRGVAAPLPLPSPTADLHQVLDAAPLGIYEGLRTFDDPHGQGLPWRATFLRLEQHLDRADRSLAGTGRDRRVDRAEVRQALQQAADEWGQPCRIRLDVLAGPGTALGTDSDTVFIVSPMPAIAPELRRRGVAVGLAPGMRRRQPLAKEAQWVVDRRGVAPDDAYEHLLLDEQDCALECTSANFFGLRGGTLITAGDGVLEGVTRSVVLDVARDLGLPVELRRLPPAELAQLDEAFLTSASRAVIPIIQIDGLPVGDGKAGPQVQHLSRAFDERVRRELQPAWPMP